MQQLHNLRQTANSLLPCTEDGCTKLFTRSSSRTQHIRLAHKQPGAPEPAPAELAEVQHRHFQHLEPLSSPRRTDHHSLRQTPLPNCAPRLYSGSPLLDNSELETCNQQDAPEDFEYPNDSENYDSEENRVDDKEDHNNDSDDNEKAEDEGQLQKSNVIRESHSFINGAC